MMRRPSVLRSVERDHPLVTNQVIRNTYLLLSATLLFSALMAYVSVIQQAPPMGLGVTLVYFGLIFAIHAFQNSGLGLLLVFALTGVLGYTLGPVLNAVLHIPQGGQIITAAFAGTGFIFLGLSGYALSTQRDFSYMGGFLMAGFLTLFFASLMLFFFPMPLLHVLISCGFLLLSSAAILFETSQIIHGGQRNYILATVSLYVSLYNIFISLLHILTSFQQKD